MWGYEQLSFRRCKARWQLSERLDEIELVSCASTLCSWSRVLQGLTCKALILLLEKAFVATIECY